ncbi:MAG: AraC family transcriptional regulator [Armatimonadetes bacterium]|nr:helix-turn-helix domain-containing protein [Armatimonadota bacterium]MBS1700511.1 AraC family transcriptional regulator [Armatimonadota bacterium]MBS1727335.1 AraC family transcriptional regulator [Armatimonadota bacterium]
MKEMNELRDQTNREEFVERLARMMTADGVEEPQPGLRLARASKPTDRTFGVSRPSVCVIAQGAKEIFLGDIRYRYDAEHYMIASLEMPVTGCVIEASPDRPYLSVRLELDPALIGSVMIESGLPSPSNPGDARAVFVSRLESDLLDAMVRLVRLLDKPAEAAVLLPLVKREIAFRLLMGPQGERLRHLPMLGGHSHRIAKAVDRLRRDFDQSVSMEGLAQDLGMSTSAFHHHFKTVMSMSPLQFQKLLRLQQARQLMLGESLDAASAGYRVGYDDPSHFSRDYKRHFGDAPMRDVERLRQLAVAD